MSVKARARKALADRMTEAALAGAFDRVLRIASEAEDDGDAIAAARLIAELTGCKLAEAERVVVQTVVALQDRRDGSQPAPMLPPDSEADSAPMLSGESDPE